MQTENSKIADARPSSLVNLICGLDRRDRPKLQTRGQTGAGPQPTNPQIEQVALSRLTACARNARTHSPKQIAQIATSLKRFGFLVPILVNADNEIVAGHGRAEAARLLGLTQVPVVRVSHLSPAEQHAFAIADNRLAELAGWDRNTLAVELQSLIELDFAVELTGFEMREIEVILDGAPENEAENTSGAKTDAEKSSCGPAVSRCGDVWQLGAHRLDCAQTDETAAYAAVDAAIRCWQRTTGHAAILAGAGLTFNAIAKERRKKAPKRRSSAATTRQLGAGRA